MRKTTLSHVETEQEQVDDQADEEAGEMVVKSGLAKEGCESRSDVKERVNDTGFFYYKMHKMAI